MGVDVVNLGTGESHSVYDLVNGLNRCHRRAPDDRSRPGADPCVRSAVPGRRPGQDAREYQWSPRSSLIDSLQDLWRDHDIPSELLERC